MEDLHLLRGVEGKEVAVKKGKGGK